MLPIATNGNKAAVAYTSTGIATATFIGIIIYNVCMSICKIPQLRTIRFPKTFQSIKSPADSDCVTNGHNIELKESFDIDVKAQL